MHERQHRPLIAARWAIPCATVDDVSSTGPFAHVSWWLDHVEMPEAVELLVRFTVDDEALTDLHRLAFGSSATAMQPWAQRLERHSLAWVGAFAGSTLVGFVQVSWDGGSHAFLLDTAVHPHHQRRGIGRDLVLTAATEARGAGCQWLHVDYEPHLQPFYRDSCGFRTTDAGLLSLSR